MIQQIDPEQIKHYPPRPRPQRESAADAAMRARGFLKIGECRGDFENYPIHPTPENYKYE